MFWFDPLYFVFTLPALLLALWAQYKVRSTYEKYAKIANMQRVTGDDVAHILMRGEGLGELHINRVPGQLTDFYNPADQSINLSDSSTAFPSVGAMAVVAHELGHAQQHQQGYAWMRVRAGIVGVAQLGSSLGIWLVFLGLLFGAAAGRGGFGFTIATAGFILFTGAVLFTFVTLPVELDASRRAREMLSRNGLVSIEEQQGVAAVLNAAALTYVAAAAQAVTQLLYLAFVLFGGRRDE